MNAFNFSCKNKLQQPVLWSASLFGQQRQLPSVQHAALSRQLASVRRPCRSSQLSQCCSLWTACIALRAVPRACAPADQLSAPPGPVAWARKQAHTAVKGTQSSKSGSHINRHVKMAKDLLEPTGSRAQAQQTSCRMQLTRKPPVMERDAITPRPTTRCHKQNRFPRLATLSAETLNCFAAKP